MEREIGHRATETRRKPGKQNLLPSRLCVSLQLMMAEPVIKAGNRERDATSPSRCRAPSCNGRRTAASAIAGASWSEDDEQVILRLHHRERVTKRRMLLEKMHVIFQRKYAEYAVESGMTDALSLLATR
jgi:hypothetical protein